MKIAVITSNFGNIDEVKPIPEQTVPYDYFCYDDLSKMDILYRVDIFTNSRLLSKFPKLFSHKLLPKYDIYIWIDARVEILSSDFVEKMVENLKDVKIAKHPNRETVFEEMSFILSELEQNNPHLNERYNVDEIHKQWDWINDEMAAILFSADNSLPQGELWRNARNKAMALSLYACGIFARRNNPAINKAFEEIWDLCLKFGNLDQVFYSLMERKHNLRFSTIETYPNKYFKVNSHKLRKICYTAIIGNYDKLNEVPQKQDGWRYICFTDQDIQSETWEIFKFSGNIDSKTSRLIKLLPQQFLPPHDCSLWIDGSIIINCDLDRFLRYTGICLMKHPWRKTLIEEAQECMRLKLDNEEIIKNQVIKYSEEFGIQNIGVVATGVLFRRNTRQINEINRAWWHEVETHSRRDQLSFNYVALKHKLTFNTIEFMDGFIWERHIQKNLNFITASHDSEILNKNLAKSAIFRTYPLRVMADYTNIMQAYNDAGIPEGIRIYVHHDVFLPDGFKYELFRAIDEIERIDPNWGVLGVAGVWWNGEKQIYGYLLDRGTIWGSPNNLPIEVQTIDGLFLMVKHPDLKFDENIPGNHFYGADICLQANLMGLKNYAIKAYLEHNSARVAPGEEDAGFQICKEYIKQKYQGKFPKIVTTCTIIDY